MWLPLGGCLTYFNPSSRYLTYFPMFCRVPPYLTSITGSMDRCGPVTGLVLCAVPGNKWFQKKKKKKNRLPSFLCRRPLLRYQEIPHFYKPHGRHLFPPRSTTTGQLASLLPLPSMVRTHKTTLLAFGRGFVFPSGCTLPSPRTAIL